MYYNSFSNYVVKICTVLAFIICANSFCNAQETLQVDVNALLNSRPVTTLTRGKLVTWSKGIDKEHGYLTMSAASLNMDKEPHALPDNPLISANKSHPEILLHYSNEEGLKNQASCLQDSGQFIIKVPNHKYSDFYFSLTSSYGASSLKFELVYTDGVELRYFILPDWFKDIPENDPDISYVIHNLGKWDSLNNLTEKDHHNIDALNIHPNSKRILTSIKLSKSPEGYLVFWAATGVVKK